MAQFLTTPIIQLIGPDGAPRAGAKLHVYTTGTTTPLSLFSDEALSTPAANPVIADASGLFPAIYLAAKRFKAVLTTAADVVIKTIDPAYSTVDGSTFTAEDMDYDNATSGLTANNVQDALDELSEAIDDAAGAAGGAAVKTVTITGGGLATGGGTLEANRVITVTEATENEAKAGSASTVVITPRRLQAGIKALVASLLPLAYADFSSTTLNSSFNVTSVTSLGSNRYRLTFTAALPANYVAIVTGTTTIIDLTPAGVLQGGQRTSTVLDVIASGRTSVVIFGTPA